MGDLSKHFSRHEMACHCGCGFDKVDPQLVERLETIREHFGVPVRINAACRCAKHNATIPGSAKNSQHILGTAADIAVQGVKPSDVATFAEKTWPTQGGVGRYNTFTHIDVRKAVARWTH